MTTDKAPERSWTVSHLGEYGNYYPEAVEAEGEHGGTAVELVRGDIHQALEAERDKLQKALEMVVEEYDLMPWGPTLHSINSHARVALQETDNG